MANLSSVGTPDVNKRAAEDMAGRVKPRRQTATSLRERQGRVPSQYATGGRPQPRPQRQVAQAQAPVKPAYQQAAPVYQPPTVPVQQPSVDMTQAGWATGANTGMRPARPDLGQTPLAPPVRPGNYNYQQTVAPVQSGGFTGGRPVMAQPSVGVAPQAQQPIQNRWAANRPVVAGYTPSAQRNPWANQYNPYMNRRRW